MHYIVFNSQYLFELVILTLDIYCNCKKNILEAFDYILQLFEI